jgi:hypothetical protein
MTRPRVYIAGPITRGDLKHNVDQATAAFVALSKAGYAPLCPHWSVYAKPAISLPGPVGADPFVYCRATRNGNEEMTHADWIGADLPWVEVSDAVLRLPGESTGADLEVEHAVKNCIPVFHSIDELLSHFAQEI